MLYKDSDTDISRMFAELAGEELRHVTRLHDEVVELIEKARESGETVPTGMMEIYEYLHKRQIEKTNQAKNYLSQAKA